MIVDTSGTLAPAEGHLLYYEKNKEFAKSVTHFVKTTK